MGFFEDLRDHTRDEICGGLPIAAQMAERGRAEEKIGGSGSLGLIDLPNGPIRWLNVRRQKTGGSGTDGGVTQYRTEYGVPDSKVRPGYDRLHVNAVRLKTFPLFGRVVGLRWQGDDLGVGLIDRLNSDDSLKDPLMASCDLNIHTYGEYRCWIMSTPWITKTMFGRSWRNLLVPSAELWKCYEVVAGHLLETPQLPEEPPAATIGPRSPEDWPPLYGRKGE